MTAKLRLIEFNYKSGHSVVFPLFVFRISDDGWHWVTANETHIEQLKTKRKLITRKSIIRLNPPEVESIFEVDTVDVEIDEKQLEVIKNFLAQHP